MLWYRRMAASNVYGWRALGVRGVAPGPGRQGRSKQRPCPWFGAPQPIGAQFARLAYA